MGQGAVMLYNNSTGRDYLTVHDVQGQLPGFNWCYAKARQGTLGTKYADPVPVVTGEALPSGQTFVTELASDPGADYILQGPQGSSPAWVHPFPLAVIQPGWAFMVYDSVQENKLFGISFYFEMVPAEDLDYSLADLALKLAGG